ncbi:Ig-like domain-containing protein [Pseudomonas yamanorum]|uniref:Ig-like domain-containing protein n=1 Tax=Pseudomonas yamanorum TaxID=515393 RepID=UPI002ED43960|nr:Ig-like domain-containing protein [Pseudomonas yamanorum]
MESRISVTNKANHVKIAAGNETTLREPSVVQVAAKRSDVRNMERQGDTLVMTLASGTVMKIHGFFPPQGATQNSLVLQDGKQLWMAEFSANGQVAGQYVAIDSVEPLLVNSQFDMSDTGWIMGGLLAAGAAALAFGGGGGGGGNDDAVPPVVNPPVDLSATATPGKDGSVVLNGKTTPGAAVQVTFGDGSTVSTVAGKDGTFTATSTPNQPTGAVTVTATDPTGKTSQPVKVDFTDVTAPVAPQVTIAKGDQGAVVANGTAEPGTVVKVTFPDGSTATVTADDKGEYSVTSSPNQPSGAVTVITTDKAGHDSPPTQQPFTDTTAPLLPQLSVTVDDAGLVTAKGTAEPGSQVKVTFPDGTSVVVIADDKGQYSAISPTAQPNGGMVTAVATDTAGNVSPAAQQEIAGGTPALKPDMGLAVGENGAVTATGNAEPGSHVKVTFPDGKSVDVTANDKGQYTATSAPNQPSGNVTATATDNAGNVSELAQKPFTDTLVPQIPGLAVATGEQGAIVASGTAEPGSTIKMTFPDGKSVEVKADDKGQYTATSEANQPSGSVTAVAIDKASNVSLVATEPFVDTTAPAAPTLALTKGDQGAIVVSGNVEPGSTVKVTFPDGKTVPVPVNERGEYSITSAANQPSGNVSAVATDKAGNNSLATQQAFVDVTAPLKPELGVAVGENGAVTASGNAEPGSHVKVTFPDGKSVDVTANDKGQYTATSAPNQPSGNVTVTVTDNAGNVSELAQKPFIDTLVPQIPDLGVATGKQGAIVASGTAEPGSTIKVTFPDGKSVEVKADDKGQYTATSEANQPSGSVTAVAIDKASNVSLVATEPFVDTTAPAAPTLALTKGDQGAIVVSGNVEPGSTVKVTFPDGKTVPVPVNERGEYSITSAANQPSGNVSAVATDKAGNNSLATQQAFVDVTAPLKPELGVAVGENGAVTASGNAEPGSHVKVTFPDGKSVDVTANDKGQYTATSAPNQPSGNVTVTVTDNAGNVSELAQKPFIDTLVPQIPDLGVATGKQGAIVASGTAEPGSTIKVTFPDGKSVEVKTGDKGQYTATSEANQPSGNVTAVAIDKASNVSLVATEPFVDTTAPAAPVLVLTKGDQGAIVASGNAEPGSTVKVTFPDGKTVSGATDQTGVYSITSEARQPSGNVTAVATDKAGNSGQETQQVFADTTAPLAPTLVLAHGNLGAAVASGTAEPGSRVKVTFSDGQQVEATVKANGDYSATSAINQPSGPVTAVATDKAGNIGAAVDKAFIDTTAPLPPSLAVAANDSGAITATGLAEPGSTVKVTFTDGATLDAKVNAKGVYTVTSAANQPTGSISAIAIDKVGNSSTASHQPYTDTLAPAAPTLILTPGKLGAVEASGVAEPGSTVKVTFTDGKSAEVIADENGAYWVASARNQPTGNGYVQAYATDRSGNQGLLVIQAFADTTAPLPPILLLTNGALGTVVASGTAELNSKVKVTFSDGKSVEVPVNEKGLYSVTSATNQPTGAVTAVAIDKAGNISLASNMAFTDTTAPQAPSLAVAVNDSGAVTAKGTTEPGSTVKVTFTDGSVLDAKVNSKGDYSVTSAANQPTGSVSAIATDKAGLPSQQAQQLYVDAMAPAVPGLELANGKSGAIVASGIAEPGSTVKVTFPAGKGTEVLADEDGKYSLTSVANQPSGTVSASATDAAGNASPSVKLPYVDTTAPQAPSLLLLDGEKGTVVVSGTAELNTTVKVTFSDGTWVNTPVNAQGLYSVTSPANQPTGTVTAVAIDKAGNTSLPKELTFTDTTAPVTPTLIVTATANDHLSVIGTTEPAAKVTVTFPDGTRSTIDADAKGTFTTVSEKPQMAGDVTAVAQDLAGNSSTKVTLKVLPAPSLMIVDDVEPHTGGVSVATPVTNDALPTFRGTGEAGETINLAVGSQPVVKVQVGADGIWSYTPLTALADGPYTVHASRGDQGLVASQSFIVDTVAPLKPTLLADTGKLGVILASGTTEAGDTVHITFPDGSSATVIADEKGAYSVTSAINQPSGDVTASATDLAGNAGPASKQAFVDTTAPLPPTLVLTDAKQGAAVASGNAEPGSSVKVTFSDGKQVDVPVQANGEYSVTSAANLPSGKVTVVATDRAGNASPVQEKAFVDTTGPIPPTLILISNPDARLAVVGGTEPLASVTVTFPDGTRSTVVADASGTFKAYSGTSQHAGDITAVATDLAGNPGKPATLTVMPPPLVVIADDVAPQVGILSGPLWLTNDTLPTFGGKVEAGVTIKLVVGTQPIATVVAGPDGYWSYTPKTALAEGQYSVAASQGDFGLVTVQKFIVKTTPPAVSQIDVLLISNDTVSGVLPAALDGLDSTADSGANFDFVTRDPQLTVVGRYKGTLAANEFIKVSSDGGVTWNEATVNSEKSLWSFVDPVVHSGPVTYQVQAVDGAGNVAPAVAEKRVDIQLNTPSMSLSAPELGTIAGLDTGVVGDHITTKAGQIFGSSVSGKATPGDRVLLINDVNRDGVYSEGIDTVQALSSVTAKGDWVLLAKLPEGQSRLGFVEVDTAGNRSRLSATTDISVVSADQVKVSALPWGDNSDAKYKFYASATTALNEDGQWMFFQTSSAEAPASIYTVGPQGVTQESLPGVLARPMPTGASLADFARVGYPGVLMPLAMPDKPEIIPATLGKENSIDPIGYVISQILNIFMPPQPAPVADNSAPVAVQQDYWYTANGTDYKANASQDSFVHHGGGVAIFDKTGQGNLGAALGDFSGQSLTFLNRWFDHAVPQENMQNLNALAEVSSVDLNNDGKVDVAMNTLDTLTGVQGSLTLFLNDQTANGFKLATVNEVFKQRLTDAMQMPVSMTWADFNGDGFMDLYLNRGRSADGTEDSDNARIYWNNGKGGFGTQAGAAGGQASYFSDTVIGAASIAVDWNHDGKMDVVKLSMDGYKPSLLYLNRGNGGFEALAFNTSGDPRDASDPDHYEYRASGGVAVDYNWDGAVDLVVYNQLGAPTLALNTNTVAAGTSLHLRIVDAQGINSLYGNTVQLYDNTGKLVGTQVLNPQSGIGTNDGSGIVNFYGLDAAHTYSALLVNSVDGIAANVGGKAVLGNTAVQNVNAGWDNLVASEATQAYVLTSNADKGLVQGAITGTGYDDTFIASAGKAFYDGTGGWDNARFGNPQWTAAGGENTLDFQLAGKAGVTVSLDSDQVQETGFNTVALRNIQGLKGSEGDDHFTASTAAGVNNVFEGRGGNDTFTLNGGGHTSLIYNLLDKADATGGNGSDTVIGFTQGRLETTGSADVVDLSRLLTSYAGTSYVFKDMMTDKYQLDSASQGLNKYLQVSSDASGTKISVDLNGGGNFSEGNTLLTLSGVQTDLSTLLANHQLTVV